MADNERDAYIVQKLNKGYFQTIPEGKPMVFFSEQEVLDRLGVNHKPGTQIPRQFIFPTEENLETTHYQKNGDEQTFHSVRLGLVYIPNVENNNGNLVNGINQGAEEDPTVAQGGKRKTRRRSARVARIRRRL